LVDIKTLFVGHKYKYDFMPNVLVVFDEHALF